MILQELHRYYERKTAADPNSLAPEGFERKEISFTLLLTPDGRLVGLEDLREGKRGVERLVPAGVKRTAGIRANLLWDNLEYVLGVPTNIVEETAKKWLEEHPGITKDQSIIECAPSLLPNRSNDKYHAFFAEIKSLNLDSDPGVQAVLKFLSGDELKRVAQEPNWPEVLKAKGNLSFRIQDDLELVCQRTEVRQVVLSRIAQSEGPQNLCLVRGVSDSLAITHPSIKGVWGAKESGANIVSFNELAFCSQGKKQGANAPVGRSAAFTYTTALNHLLRSDSTQRLKIGDTSTVFWAAEDTQMEDIFGEVFADNPDHSVREVREALTSLHRGGLNLNEGATRFFVLGLAPNSARIAVRFWHVTTVAELAEHLAHYFEELEIAHSPQENGFLTLSRLLKTTAVQSKSDNVNPRMSGELVHAILSGIPYPRSLLHAVITRIKAEQIISFPRAALLKAWLNRHRRFYSTSEQEMLMALDLNNTNPGYRLGRLFAVLERAQGQEVNAGIRERYYGAASSTPATVFPLLLKNYPHHLKKLEKGKQIRLDKLVQSILLDLQDFQKVLKVEDQGRFAIGYYHQRQDFFTKKEQDFPKGGSSSSGEEESAVSAQPELI
jgi:CRISPR-associated protein Csd1